MSSRWWHKEEQAPPTLADGPQSPLEEALDPLVVFIDIPGAGGHSFAAVLKRVYGGSHTKRIDAPATLAEVAETYNKLPFDERKELEVLFGHMPFGFHAHVKRRIRYVTMIREPIDMIEDLFYFVRDEVGPTHCLYTEGMTLEGWADNPPREIDNSLVRYICGINRDSINVGGLHSGHLDAAKLQLSTMFTAVGQFGGLDRVLRICADQLGWQKVPKVPATEAVTRQRHTSINKRLERKFDKVTRLDRELYTYATGIATRKPSRTDAKSLDLSIVLGTYNRLDHLTRCINSLRSCVGSLSYEIVVCDAGSIDGSREWLAAQEDVVLLAERVREGAVKAFNKGYAVSRGRAIAFMNDDVIAVDKAGLEKAVEVLRRPGVGQIACAYNHRHERSFSVQSVHGKSYANLGIISREVAERVITITGGLWSPCYHTYGADTELSCWIHKLGLEVVPLHNVRFTDQHAEDELRIHNQKRARADNAMFWARWPDARMIEPNGIDPKVTGVEMTALRSAQRTARS